MADWTDAARQATATDRLAQAQRGTATATGRLADAHTRQAVALESIAATLKQLIPAVSTQSEEAKP